MRFPGFEGEWEEKELGDFLEFKNGINASKEQYGKGIKFINVLDILNNDFITYEKITGRVNVSIDIAAKYPVNYGDILFQRSSETREEVGTANVYLDKKHTATFGGFVIRGRKIGEYEPMFLNKLLKTDNARNNITSRSGGSTRYNVGQETLSSIELHFPTLPEQKIIASFLSLIDKRIETQSKIIENLESLMKGFREKIFSQDLRFKDDNGNEFPDWQLKKLGDVCIITMGQSPSSTSYNTDEIGIPLIQGNADILNRITFPRNWTTDITKECKIGDLILTVRAPAGAVAKSLHNACIGRGVCAISVNSKYPIEFIYQYLIYFEDKWSKLEQGSTFTAISGNEIKKIELNIPSCIKEQSQIADLLFKIDKKIEIERKLLQQFKNQKINLLSNLFL